MQNDDPAKESLSLKDLIRRVQSELMESQFEREARGEDALFEVENLTLEVNFVVTKSKGASGGFEFKVLTFGGIKAGGDVEHQEQQTHKIILSLKTHFRSLTPGGNASLLKASNTKLGHYPTSCYSQCDVMRTHSRGRDRLDNFAAQ